MKELYRRLPAALIALRLALGPVIIVAAARHTGGGWIGALLTAGFLSDVFDGIIARRLEIATERIRVADSMADAVFYGCAAIAVGLWHRAQVAPFAALLTLMLAVTLASAAADLARYRRISSYHTLAAKTWGITLFAAAISLLCFDQGKPVMQAVGIVGIYASLEGIAITLLLPEWRHDVPTLWHAMQLRKANGRKDQCSAGR
jgi:CDP-diacylglycerol--glycerol-3-phosphate 3-phosphatidyltransferase